eukprot:CAMPEP_0172840738 /NCGR_PEP_ID=MMETSP1075-20121228/29532_1 /TAXON_ID=2916 /ORGANISM="Ceratium fusus, Strain PA161109" /LENGTH=54 /DNA_ID=CAMNT_0013684623 /DNA_START=654 /DNA_END=818 /DNA_ORIENTATION=+
MSAVQLRHKAEEIQWKLCCASVRAEFNNEKEIKHMLRQKWSGLQLVVLSVSCRS